MARRGNKPTATVTKLVRGNPGKRPIAAVDEAPEGDLICPRAVSDNERARRYWDFYIAVTAPGHLRPVDGPLLARLCVCHAVADEASEKLYEHGLLVKAPKSDTAIQNPYLGIVGRQTEMIRKLASELCLTPSERNRSVNATRKEPDPAEAFFS